MNGVQVFQLQFDRLLQEFEHSLKNLSQPKLAWRPAPQMNDVGSLVWHSARAWDGYLYYLDGEKEQFVTQNWAKRFGMKRLPNKSWIDVFTEDQLAFVRAKPKLFLEYMVAIHASTKNDLACATPRAQMNSKPIPPQPVRSSRRAKRLLLRTWEDNYSLTKGLALRAQFFAPIVSF